MDYAKDNYASKDEPNTNFAEELTRARSRLEAVAERVGALADQLCGQQGPQPGTGSGLRAVDNNGGLLGSVSENAAGIQRLVDGINESLSRISNRL